MSTSETSFVGPAIKPLKRSLSTRVRERLQKRRIKQARRPDDLREVHAAYWSSVAPHEYYDRVMQRFEEWFYGPHAGFVDAVVDLSEAQDFDRLIEFGCGDGEALSQLSRRITDIPTLIGIDLNTQIIERNKTAYAAQKNMSFFQGDLTQIVPLCTARNTLYFVYGGVLEYFTQDELTQIFKALAQQGSAIAFAEPIDPDHDLTTTPQSYAFGGESSFSHNHAQLLNGTGWQITHHEEVTFADVRWQMVIAEAGV